MGTDALSNKEMGRFLRQYCGVLVRDWQTAENWEQETATFRRIIQQLEGDTNDAENPIPRH
jgi:hypothetical protein